MKTITKRPKKYKPFKVVINESERGWGQSEIGTRYFDTIEAADKFVDEYNKQNTAPTAPVYYDDLDGQVILDEIAFNYDTPSCVIEFNFGYGSKYDGTNREFHFNRENAEKLYELLTKEHPELLIHKDN
jgi:hypothetical protein